MSSEQEQVVAAIDKTGGCDHGEQSCGLFG
jgi:hypothetical protein